MSNAGIHELTAEQLNRINGGEVTVTVEKGYVGVEISIGGYGVAVWATGGSICGQLTTPSSRHNGCSA